MSPFSGALPVISATRRNGHRHRLMAARFRGSLIRRSPTTRRRVAPEPVIGPRLARTRWANPRYARFQLPERRIARSQHPPSSKKPEFPRPHSLHRPAFLWSNRSEVWGRTLVELAQIRRPRLIPVTLD